MAETGNNRLSSIINGMELPEDGRSKLMGVNPFTHEIISKIICATPEDARNAVAGAHRAYSMNIKKMPAHLRAEILKKTAEYLQAESDEFIHLLSNETGKTVKESRQEVERAIQVLLFSSTGAQSIYRELIPLGSSGGAESRLGMSKRVSIGTVVIVMPFNLPLNLVLYHIAPAIAAGNTVVFRPSLKTARSSVYLCRLFEKAGLPKGAFTIVLGVGEDLTQALVTHPKVKKVFFTGKDETGWKVKEMVKRKKLKLETESKVVNVIFDDADLDTAVNAVVIGGFRFAGQSFVSTQRVYVQEIVYMEFLDKLSSKVKTLKIGDPLDELTDIGPMITKESAEKAMAWVREAIEQGATLLTGGNRREAVMEPTLISHATIRMKVVSKQMLAPVVSVMPFDKEEQALTGITELNLDRYAAVFTADIRKAVRVADVLGREAVWINEVAVNRYDQMPYGGVNNRGMRRKETYRAIEDMTELKLVSMQLKQQ